MAETKRAADWLAERLYQAGCRYAFGMPGGEVLTLVDALTNAGIEFVLCKHENAAGFMAEGTYHMTGAPGILVATVGPGAMNGVNSVANAEQDRVPLIVLTGCVDADEALLYTHQILDQRKVFEEITKATFTLTAKGADTIADKAVAIATEPRPGPVHIDVPISVADTQIAIETKRRRVMPAPAVPAPETLATARSWLAGAKRPIIIAGLDILDEGSHGALTGFAEKFQIPVVTTYKAKGVIPEDHDLALGGAGLSPLADKHLLPLVRASDLIICAGYDPIEMRPGWQEVWDPTQQNVLDIHAAPNHHYMHQATLSILGHTGETLTLLGQDVEPHLVWEAGEVGSVKAALTDAFPKDDDWGPGAVIAETRAELPRDTLATADSGAHRILLSQMWECYGPRQLTQSTGLCTMGVAMPLAMGLAHVDPNRTVVSFSGDAGFLMTAGELSTAAELNSNVIFIVFVDASLSLIELKQRQRQMGNRGVDFARHDFAALAEAFGGTGHTVTSRAELRTALREAQENDGFNVIAAVIDRKAYDGRI